MTHPHEQQRVDHVPCGVITVSDTRTPTGDLSGRLIRDQLTAAGHVVYAYDVIPDEPALVAGRVAELRDDDRCRAVLLTGGTGVGRRDATYEAIAAMLDKRLDGFGELFRQLSYAEIGAAAMLSRAVAGTTGDTVVFSMPGSTGAVRLAMEKLIIPQLGHVVYLMEH